MAIEHRSDGGRWLIPTDGTSLVSRSNVGEQIGIRAHGPYYSEPELKRGLEAIEAALPEGAEMRFLEFGQSAFALSNKPNRWVWWKITGEAKRP